MKSNLFFTHINRIATEKTSHGIGYKKVLITNNQCESNLMQAAFGQLESGQQVDEHKHPTMEEFYLFNKGVVIFNVEGTAYRCETGSFIKVPANALHSLFVEEHSEFTYWGIAL